MASSEPVAVNRKTRVGTVVSDKMEQTLVVSIERTKRHPLYRKVIRRTKKYHVHDPEGLGTLGDLVRIEECRPISRTKSWQLVEVLTERAVADVAAEEIDSSLVDELQRSAVHRDQEAEPAGDAATDAADTTDAVAEQAPRAEDDAEAAVAEPAVTEPAVAGPASDEDEAAPSEDDK